MACLMQALFVFKNEIIIQIINEFIWIDYLAVFFWILRLAGGKYVVRGDFTWIKSPSNVVASSVADRLLAFVHSFTYGSCNQLAMQSRPYESNIISRVGGLIRRITAGLAVTAKTRQWASQPVGSILIWVSGLGGGARSIAARAAVASPSSV